MLHCLNLLLSSSVGGDKHILIFSRHNSWNGTLLFIAPYSWKMPSEFPKFSYRSGEYRETWNTCIWIYQLWVWILIILVVKAIIWISMNIFRRPLQFFFGNYSIALTPASAIRTCYCHDIYSLSLKFFGFFDCWQLFKEWQRNRIGLRSRIASWNEKSYY